MLGNGGVGTRGAWPLGQTPATAEPTTRYGVYSLFPGAGSPAPALPGLSTYHAQHKVTEALFASSQYSAFGAPTPPPGSPYSPLPVQQLELLAKGLGSPSTLSNISTSKALHIHVSTPIPTTAVISTLTTSTPAPVLTTGTAGGAKRCCWMKSCSCKPMVKLQQQTGCSRTNPVEWNSMTVKREPCQVAEVTTSERLVKVEADETAQQGGNNAGTNNNGNTNGGIPVGIAVARQRLQQQEMAAGPQQQTQSVHGLLQPLKDIPRIQDIDPVQGGVSINSGSILCEDRPPGLAWPVAGATPTLWQYPAPMPVEPMLPLPIPVPPLGYQLVRDPSSGHFLLIPTASLEQVGQAVVWPTYPQPPLLLPPPPPLAPLQLLSSSQDFLATSTTLQHSTTSTRLVVTGSAPASTHTAHAQDKRAKLLLPAHAALIKLEDCASDQPVLVYQPNLILQDTGSKNQGTSPGCLTPPPEGGVQDASNQTEQHTLEDDHPISDKNLNPSPVICTEPEEAPSPIQEIPSSPIVTPSASIAPTEQPEVKLEQPNHPDPDPDISGLELLSNSIEEFENINRTPVKYEKPAEDAQRIPERQEQHGDDVLTGIAHMTLKDKIDTPGTNVDDNLGGLGLLCALAEQRFMEEVNEQRKEKRKIRSESKEPKSKRPKTDENIDCTAELEQEKLTVFRRVAGEKGLLTPEPTELPETNNNCSCREYKSKALTKNWSPEFMSAVERDMRQELADLQRRCKEKKLELSKLTPTKKITTPPPQLDKIDPIITLKPTQELLKPPTLCPIIPKENYKHKLSLDSDSASTSTTPEKMSSSKKRKVGRPKKLLSFSGLKGATTETIVAKKPRAKAGLVGYILAAKNRLQMQHKAMGYRESSPPRYSEDVSSPNNSPAKKKIVKTALPAASPTDSTPNRSKIRPKLKAEPTIKPPSPPPSPTPSVSIPSPDSSDQSDHSPLNSRPSSPQGDTRCVLTSYHLGIDKLRVLTAMGGLFYAGQLTAVRAPDVYAITLDGERGNRPHIMSREEILRDAIVEVSPSDTASLLPGTRLCAYWSQQYRCLYPGTVAEPGTPDPQLDLRFVAVEFDDGDSGRIALDDIRLLPTDYPIIEYDPNPLLSLSKRRRRTSTNSDERKPQKPPIVPTQESKMPMPQESKILSPQAEKENTDINLPIDDVTTSHKERKRLKKRRKDKLKKLLHEDKKRRRKHRCCEEKCKHRKHHRKHRKHKKHHHRTEEIAEEVVEEQGENKEEEGEKEDEEEKEMEEVDVVPKKVENKIKKSKKKKERRESVESRSKMAAFLPARQLWSWSGRGYKRVGVKGRARKQFFKAIQRGKESIMVGDCAVFLSTGRPDRPYIGKIEAMWESWGTNMVVRVKWFYHPEETVGCPLNLKYPGALFESPHIDENDVQTISHKCEVLPLQDYTDKLGSEPQRYETIYDNNDIYYQAGYYDPTTTTLTMKPDIPFIN